jgi:hypothetical protein
MKVAIGEGVERDDGGVERMELRRDCSLKLGIAGRLLHALAYYLWRI